MIWLDRKYASLTSPYVELYKEKSRDPFLANFRCPFCGDSQSNANKARGYLFEDKDVLKFKCHNCGEGFRFQTFLKRLNHSMYRNYCMEKFAKPEVKVKQRLGEVKELKKKVKSGIEALFEPLGNVGIEYLASRKIEKRDDLYFATDFKVFQKFFPDKELPSDRRIIIPIRNRQGELVGMNARAIDKTKLRYVLLKLKEDESLIYNIDKVDISKRVWITEGAIDSFFLDNAVAANGSDLEKVFQTISKQSGVLIYDHQPRNKEILNKMLHSCNQGYNMVVWPSWIEGKDINDMYQIYGKEKLMQVLNDNVFSGLKARAKISNWRKI